MQVVFVRVVGFIVIQKIVGLINQILCYGINNMINLFQFIQIAIKKKFFKYLRFRFIIWYIYEKYFYPNRANIATNR